MYSKRRSVVSHNAFSIKKFIHEYTELLKNDYRGFTARPWNRFRPEDTKWWVVPSTAWPSFGNEKLCFWCSGKYLYGGFNVEKGNGRISSTTALPALLIQWLTAFMQRSISPYI